MGRKRAFVPLDVFLNSRRVGTFERKSGGAVAFAYHPTWLAWEHTMPISLSLPLREEPYGGAAVTAVFENLLPDDAGIRRKLAEHTGAAGTDAFSLLGAIGRDCVGALQFLPSGETPSTGTGIEAETLTSREIATLLRSLSVNPLGVENEGDFRISIAGAQEKTALLFHRKKWRRPIGATATTHILKPQIGKLGNGIDLSQSVENEHLCLRLCRELGLPTANTEILDFEDRRVLVVERFDRLWTADKRLLRVPQEDCCQALGVPPTQKYQSEGGPGIAEILALLGASDAAAHDQAIFLKAQMVFWLLGATDGHAKNFSIHLRPGGGFRLAPLYDVVSLQPAVTKRQLQASRMKMAMRVGNGRHYVVQTIRPEHFAQTAAKGKADARIVGRVAQELRAEVADAMERTREAMPKKFPQAIADAILGGVEKRAKLLRM